MESGGKSYFNDGRWNHPPIGTYHVFKNIGTQTINIISVDVILRVTSVLIKNVNFEMFFKREDCSCFLNFFWNSIPDQRSHNLNHFSTIIIISSLGVKIERLLNITNVKKVFLDYICASSG